MIDSGGDDVNDYDNDDHTVFLEILKYPRYLCFEVLIELFAFEYCIEFFRFADFFHWLLQFSRFPNLHT